MLYKNQSKGNKSKTEQGRVTVLVHCISSHCSKHAYQVWNDLNLQSYAQDKEIPPRRLKSPPKGCRIKFEDNPLRTDKFMINVSLWMGASATSKL